MRSPAAVVIVASLLSFHPLFAARTANAQPSENVRYQMQKAMRQQPWLHIATDSGVITRRVHVVDRLGLYELSAPDGSTRPGPLLWSGITRVDEVRTRSGQMRRLGAVVLGLTCAGLGNALGAPNQRGGQYAMLGVSVGFGVGGALGARYGERFKTPERNWYAADPESAKPEVLASPRATSAPADPMASALIALAPSPSPGAPADSLLPAAAATTTSVVAGTNADVLRACERIHPEQLLRVHSRLGVFEGYARMSGPQGLERLTPRRAPRRGETAAALPALIAWDAIDRVEVRGGSSLRGAIGGAATFAVLGALLGAAVVSLAGSGVEVGEGAAIGALYVAPVGFVLGGLGGMAARRWITIYPRR